MVIAAASKSVWKSDSMSCRASACGRGRCWVVTTRMNSSSMRAYRSSAPALAMSASSRGIGFSCERRRVRTAAAYRSPSRPGRGVLTSMSSLAVSARRSRSSLMQARERERWAVSFSVAMYSVMARYVRSCAESMSSCCHRPRATAQRLAASRASLSRPCLTCLRMPRMSVMSIFDGMLCSRYLYYSVNKYHANFIPPDADFRTRLPDAYIVDNFFSS